jgi:hypothetical protein
MKELDDLIGVVNAQQTIVDGLGVTVDAVIAKLNELATAITNTVDPNVLKALSDKTIGWTQSLTANKDRLIAAVTNVP